MTLGVKDGNYDSASSTKEAFIPQLDYAYMTLSSYSFNYTGKAIVPSCTVNLFGRTHAKGRDYTVSCSQNMNGGTATIVAKGIGSYSGQTSTNFKINPISQTFTAKMTSPLVQGKTAKIKVSGNKSSLSYKSNSTSVASVSKTGVISAKSPGTAKITITAAKNSNYKAASKTISIKVIPQAMSNFSASNQKTTTILANWKKNAKATGYQIQLSTKKTFPSGTKSALIKKNGTMQYKFTKLSKKKTYYLRIRAYKTVGKTKYYSAWSAVKNVKVLK